MMLNNLMIGSIGSPGNIQAKNLIHFNKLDKLLCTKSGVEPGVQAIIVDKNYAEHVCIIKRVVRQVPTKKEYCKAFDVVVSHNGENINACCIYFGSLSKVCLVKGIKYEKFDDLI